jgi:tetratricopeptide (TPR) repeat protein
MEGRSHLGRSIRTVADVETVLDSNRASFEEYLDCVRVCEVESAWDLREEASRRALEAAISSARIQAPNLITAAEYRVKSILRRANSLSDLPSKVTEAVDLIDSIERSMPGRDARREDFSSFGKEKVDQLRELILYIANPSAASLLRLCARLRRWVERPDLAVEAGKLARNMEPENPAVLTSLGAAHTDLGEYREARQLLRTVLKADPDEKRALTALSRVEQETNNLGESYRLALRAFELEPDTYSAHRLLSSALEKGPNAFREAKEVVSSVADLDTEFSEDGYSDFLAAKVLYEDGQLEVALAALRAVVGSQLTSPPVRKLARQLIKKIEEELRRRQGRFDLGEDED